MHVNSCKLRVGLKTVGINPVPFRSDFYILLPRFRRTNSESIRNSECQIRKRVENGLAPIPIISAFPVFDRDIPFLQIRNILYLQPTNPNKCEVLLNLNGLAQINRETLSTRPPHASASLNPAASLPQCLWSRSPATTRRQATAAEPLLRTSPDRR